ncbi:hypothetical protein DXG01_015711, partial [Tephrocybe rancida]
KPRRQEDEETDEEEAYERCHMGYDLNNEAIWLPIPQNTAKITFDTTESLKHLTISHTSSPPKRQRPPLDFSAPYTSTFTTGPQWIPNVCPYELRQNYMPILTYADKRSISTRSPAHIELATDTITPRDPTENYSPNETVYIIQICSW